MGATPFASSRGKAVYPLLGVNQYRPLRGRLFILNPGTYTLSDIQCSYSVPMIIRAGCYIPLTATINVKSNSITYVGNITATIKERTNEQDEPAGPPIPLIDQAIVGFYSGTFDVNIEDKYEEDMTNYRNEYPSLKTVQVEKAILPQWQRAGSTNTAK